VIKSNSSLLEDLANTLLCAETLSGPALEVFLEGVKLWPRPLVPAINGDAPVKLRVLAEAITEDTGVDRLDWPTLPVWE
jgi:hypothetical protein